MRQLLYAATGCGSLLVVFAGVVSADDGATVYKQICASCHESGLDRAPDRDALRAMSPERVLAALEAGAMISMTAARSAAERRAVAEFVTGKSFGQALDTTPTAQAMCGATAGRFANPLAGPRWNGWGVNTSNTRLQDGAMAGFTAAQVPRLKLKWAFGFPGDARRRRATHDCRRTRVRRQPERQRLCAERRVRTVSTGRFRPPLAVRAAVTIGRIATKSGTRYAAFIGDRSANVYAVDAATGKLMWKTRVDNFPIARVTGSPVFHNGRLYVGVASGEETAGAPADYECCRFRGSLVALNGATGTQIWKTYTIAEDAQPAKKNKAGTQMWGPSGAPDLDQRRDRRQAERPLRHHGRQLQRSADQDERRLRGVRSEFRPDPLVPPDDWRRTPGTGPAGCRIRPTVPISKGPDFDFASPPILVTLANGRRALVAGQKSGVVHALDPDREGEVLWQVRIGKGGINGGVQWGSAADQSNVYVALSDIGRIDIPNSAGDQARSESWRRHVRASPRYRRTRLAHAGAGLR